MLSVISWVIGFASNPMMLLGLVCLTKTPSTKKAFFSVFIEFGSWSWFLCFVGLLASVDK